MQAEFTQDAIQKAERIMRQIDARWPDQRSPDGIAYFFHVKPSFGPNSYPRP